jgi:hypothetical protein
MDGRLMTMEAALRSGLDCPTDASTSSPLAKRKRRSSAEKRRIRPQLLLRSDLDGRTNAAKYFDRLVSAIEADLAGPDQLSSIEKVLVEAYAGAAVSLQHLNSLLALGQEIDISQHAQCVGALVRVASRLGIHRRPRDVTPTLYDIAAEIHATEAAEAAKREGGTS